MASRWPATLLSCALLAALGAAAAQEPDKAAEVAEKIAGAKADQLRATPVAGIYEYTRGAEIAYVTADGRYALSGDLFELKSNRNLTEEHRRELRARLIAAVPESEMLIFAPPEPKYTVTVFTDVDCAFCRKLHSQIGEFNRLGVRVRYLLYPRTGPNTVAWTKAEQVWCSADRNDALTRAKLGQELKTKPCADNPVAHTWALGKDFAIDGTPAIVLPNGDMLPGYVPPDVLVAQLRDGGAR
ncbi:MAG: DsbC family protein [Gammaproteobacteria bacterium]|nr:DsbC family protein [Gammaproteobacteria bacterium]